MEEEINGFYDDDGNKLNPSLYPNPQLCLSCKLNDCGDEEEEILCTLNRLDQRHEKEFRCGMYENINGH